jgi:hypothetical protein
VLVVWRQGKAGRSREQWSSILLARNVRTQIMIHIDPPSQHLPTVLEAGMTLRLRKPQPKDAQGYFVSRNILQPPACVRVPSSIPKSSASVAQSSVSTESVKILLRSRHKCTPQTKCRWPVRCDAFPLPQVSEL